MIYLDNNATTPLLPEVREAMLPFLGEHFANPSSPYQAGRRAAMVLAEAREQVAALIGADPSEVVFTSGGSESNQTALAMGGDSHPDRTEILISSVEHPSVRNFCNSLLCKDIQISQCGVTGSGSLDLEQLKPLLSERTAMLSVMMANNETGRCFPVSSCASLAVERGTLFHTDAVQAVGKIPVDVKAAPIDFMSLSGHKLHGPKGIGALYIRSGLKVRAVLAGGDQEAGRRAGTEQVAGIAGFGVAARRAREELTAMQQVAALRDHFERELSARVDDLEVIGLEGSRLPNTSMIRFSGVEAEALLVRLDMEGVCCSTGSACASGSAEPSHVLLAMGTPPEQAEQVLRFSLSRLTRAGDIDRVLHILPSLVRSLRES